MISENFLKQLAQKYQTAELNVRREYAQHLFLSYFYQQRGSENVYFKGGTALRILYQSPRFSEDLDFSTVHPKIKSLESMILDTLLEIQKEGFGCEIEEAKITSGGYLAFLRFKPPAGSSVAIQLEISHREKTCQSEVATIASDFIPAYTLIHLSKKQMTEQKIRALLQRQKPRDFYDLYFMLRANLLTPQERSIVSEAAKLLTSVDIPFERELKQFLPKSHWPLIRDFPATLNREIQRFL